MRGRRRTGGTVLLALAVAMAGSGCGISASDFRADDAFVVIAPAPRAVVQVPFTVEWTADLPDAAAYAVFLNQAPVPPDRTVAWLARDDDACRASPGCPDDGWLQDRGVYLTRAESIEVTVVPTPGPGMRNRSDGGVEVVVIALDREGRRLDGHAATRLVYLASDG